MSREHITVATFQKTQSPPDDLAELVAGTTCRGCTLYNQVCSGPSVTAQKGLELLYGPTTQILHHVGHSA